MSKTARKIITALCVILFVLLIFSVLPVINFGQAYAEETIPQPAVQADEGVTEVPYPDFEMTFNGQAWNIDNTKIYRLVKIEDGEGNTVENAVDAGNYTVYVTPAENCAWKEDGTTDEKTFPLIINKATLQWIYNGERLIENRKEIKYSGDNVIAKVVARSFYDYDVITKGSDASGLKGGLEVFPILENGELGKKITKQVQDVGEYLFRLKETYEEFDGSNLYQNYTNPEFTLKIVKPTVNIGSSAYLQWVPQQGEFVSGKIYKYGYKEDGEAKTVYLTQEFEQSPFEDWTEWEYLPERGSETEVKRAILAYCEGIPRTIELARSKPGQNQFFKIVNGEYGGVVQANATGKYEAWAIISPSDNYDMVFEPDGTLNADVVDLQDGTYKVTKTWYVALYINEFLDIKSAEANVHEKIPYSFPSSWTFGTLPEGGVSYPYAAHGDELSVSSVVQPAGYWLSANKGDKWVNVAGEPIASDEWVQGEDDILTFTLKSGDTVICEDQPRSKYGDYINKYMPVGKYTISFALKDVNFGTVRNHYDWWSGVTGTSCGIEYRGISASYDFEVLIGTLLFDDSALNFADKNNPAPFRVEAGSINGDFGNFFGVANSRIVLGEGMITKGEVEKSGTYWATVADNYYSEAVELKYHLKSADDLVFYPASSDVWNSLISSEGTYYVYYTVNLLNYESVPANGDLVTEFAKQYFIIELKGNLASGFGIGRIFLYVGITLVGIGAIVAVAILLIKKRSKSAVAVADGAEEEQIETVGQEEPVEGGFDEPAEEEPVQPVEEEKSVEEEPAQPAEEEKPVEEEPSQPAEEQEYEADMAYIDKIMEQAEEEYVEEHNGEPEQQPAQPEEGDGGESNS